MGFFFSLFFCAKSLSHVSVYPRKCKAKKSFFQPLFCKHIEIYIYKNIIFFFCFYQYLHVVMSALDS